uniref:Ycf49-like protein n=1 Tax=Tetraselmis sp. GSL018 TaxID=582737 RepID=A0A061R910_9CHLO|mmetsp:Transcript_24004/g.57211  ORF Transcript_24004/g.57211 Transcript_24004/m.57211 type:complete len:382 (-) Transcript_24004:237-1382(-)
MSALPDPWGVSQEAWESVESNLFAFSLFPYLAFLWLLDRPETGCPKKVSLGYKFLLVFVFATIPAGIYAKQHYGDTLANIDWLHGTAESFLTITNIILVLGLRDAVRNSGGSSGTGSRKESELGSVRGALLGFLAVASFLGGAGAPMTAEALGSINELPAPLAWLSVPLHAEPSNALSLPTWAVHTSSVIEYLVAMGLVWQYAEVSGNPRWKGLTWGMLPSHSGGLCACTYHLFFNSPALSSIVALQALLTTVGNTTCAIAAYRLWQYGSQRSAEERATSSAGNGSSPSPTDASHAGTGQRGWEDLAEEYKSDSDAVFVAKIAGWSILLAAVIKYGELGLGFPFSEQPLLPALGCIAVPSLLNISKWASLSRSGGNDSGSS